MACHLARAWRLTAPASEPHLRINDYAPRLVETGCAALAWRRFPASSEPGSISDLFRQASRINALTGAIGQVELQYAFETLRRAHIEPLLLKGWAVARMYADASWRPSGDIDLAVVPADHAKALRALRHLPPSLAGIDLHVGLPEFHPERIDDVFARSRLVRLDGSDIRVLAPEDQLRLLCLHFLRHGGWRPLWLCDVAVMLEGLSAEFDWELCLRGSPYTSAQIALVSRLAVVLLCASPAHLHPSIRTARVPEWLLRATLVQWGSRYDRYTGMPLRDHFRLRQGRITALRRRWLNPIEATIALGAPFSGLPRLPFQVAAYGVRAFQSGRRRRAGSLGDDDPSPARPC
ncbi:MAG: hypothetical protein PVSMB1_08710 [Gemmatimonadaceae bacterium]